MFEMIGLLIGLAVLFTISLVLGLIYALVAWLIFWKRRKPIRFILFAASIPPLSVVYLLACAILFSIFIPNQPDEFFGDFSEPLPNGYVLKGLGKMPEFSRLDTSYSDRPYPQLRGGIKSLELDGEILYGAYGHIDDDPDPMTPGDRGYFVFNTKTGQVKDFATMEALNAAAGHKVQLIESQLFRSQEPSRKALRTTETVIYAFVPSVASILCFVLLIRARLRPEGKVA